MKYYDINNLIIGEVGNTSNVNNNTQVHIETTGHTIVKRSTSNQDYYYYDVITNIKYIDFHHEYCGAGQLAILNPKPLLLYIQQIYKETIQYEKIYEITTKIINLEKISDADIGNLIHYLNNKEAFINENNDSNLNILTDKKFENEPATSVDDKLNELMIILAGSKKNPILIGNIGCGRNTLINELAYRIKKNTCPKFLKGKKIIDITKIITLKNISKDLEELINNFIKLGIKNQAIFLIKEIYILYTYNSQLANTIKDAIDEEGLKVIGITTHSKYEDLIKENNLSKNWEKIFIYEPTDEALYEIMNKVFNDYSKKDKIKLLDNMDIIIKLLIDFTKEENRIWNSNNKSINTDIVYNPELVIEIIDKIFAHAKVNNQTKLELTNIEYAVNTCKKIIESAKEEIINKIKEKEKTKSKFLRMLTK